MRRYPSLGLAVCLTNSIGTHRHVVVAFITSRVAQDMLQTDVVLNNSHPEFKATGLHVTSTIRLHRLMTSTASLIQRELGVLSVSMQHEVTRKLSSLFEIRSK
jgi:mRNA interferase MazF